MPRWNNSLEDNCKSVLDNVIKNIHQNIYQTLCSDVLSSNIKNNKKVIEAYIRSKIGATATLTKKTKQYWISRGWPIEESYVKSKEHSRHNVKSAYSREFWLEKINPTTGLNYTLAEADFERNKRRPIRKEYWISKGYSDNIADQLARSTKTKNNAKGSVGSKNSSVRKVSSKRCKEYYLARGFSNTEAEDAVSDFQRFFSKEICIQKYGEDLGLIIWQNRQDRWQSTLNSKSDAEKARINKLKLFKGGSISKGESELAEQLNNVGIACKTQYAILKNKTQHFVYDIVHKNKIIEYNGDYWHASPKKYKKSDTIKFPSKTVIVEDIWNKDQEKIKFAEDQGYTVMVVWESDFKENREKVINECIQFLTQ